MRHIGVDLHTTDFGACFLDGQDKSIVKSFPLTEQGLSAFRRGLTRADRVAVEMSANAYYFHDRIVKSVRRVVLVDACCFAVVSRSKKKTDRHDAKARARFLKLGWLPEVSLPSPRIRTLRQLFHARESLVEMTTKLKNIGHAALTRNGIALGLQGAAQPRQAQAAGRGLTRRGPADTRADAEADRDAGGGSPPGGGGDHPRG